MAGTPIAGDVVVTIRAAVGLLTRVPVAVPRSSSTGAAAFSLVGAAIGIAGAVPILILPARDSALVAILDDALAGRAEPGQAGPRHGVD